MMSKRITLSAVLLALPAIGAATMGTHDETWTAYPLIKRIAPFSRASAKLKPVNIETSSLWIYPSTTNAESHTDWEVQLKKGLGQFRPRSGKQGAYHLVVAQEATPHTLRIATTAVQFPNPAPPPRRMLAQVKAELEIVPVKLPREHAHYRAGQSWDFLVRRHGQAMAGAQITFETVHGTRQTLTADPDGLIQVSFPDDFPQQNTAATAHAEHRREPKAEFVLVVQINAPEKVITSAFNFHYLPSDWEHKNLWFGSGFALLGMLAASPLLRRPRKSEKKV